MIVNRGELLFKEPVSPMKAGKEKYLGTSYGLSEAGYDIRIAEDVNFTKNFWGRRIVEVVEYDNPLTALDLSTIKRDYKRKGRFTLASAIEKFEMPDDLLGVVHDKSTWARLGLSVFNTVIEPGWKGYLTLELVYHGEDNLCIPAGSGIAQVLFHQLSNKVTYSGKYQNQSIGPTPAIFK